MRIPALVLLSCVANAAAAMELEFDEPATVAQSGPGVFYHLESSGRRSMASSGDTLALAWEDNHSRTSQIYVAFKKRDGAFSDTADIGSEAPSYEASLAGLGDGRYLVAWESGDHVWVRVFSPAERGKAVRLSQARARQISVTTSPEGRAHAVWAEDVGDHYELVTTAFKIAGLAVTAGKPVSVDQSRDDKRDQLYPSIAVTRFGVIVAWEDRRQGATRIYTDFSGDGRTFAPYFVLNDYRKTRNPKYGIGTGAMRVVLAANGRGHVAAAWLDKRDFDEGYDVYSAYSTDGGASFGDDERAQDVFGNNIPQWHAALAMDANGDLISAWDDNRDGTQDVWYSSRSQGRWSEDAVWPGGGGKGNQTNPVLLIVNRVLHAAWLQKTDTGSSIHYIKAKIN